MSRCCVEKLDHVSNGHKWSGNSLFHQCCHRRISSSEAKKICWIKPGTPAHLALEEVVLNNKLLKDLAKLTDFCQIGKIDVYLSMTLKYCSKRSISPTKAWLPGHSLLLLTTMQTLATSKLELSRVNGQVRLAINSVSLKQTSDGWSSQLVRRSHCSIYHVFFLKLSSALS